MYDIVGGSIKDDVVNFFKSGSILAQVIIAILAIIVVIIIYRCILSIVNRIIRWRQSKILLNGGNTICPKKSLVVPGEMFHKSKNELGGVEFTYTFWIFISDWSYKYGKWKHILHKGNSSSWPNRGPGIWLHPRENTMRFYMNTYDSIAGNYIDIPSIPINKWVHVVFSVNQITMDVHINGTLRKSHKFTSLPKVNFGDVFITSFRGFDGYLSKLTYYNYSIPYSEIESSLGGGPGYIKCSTDAAAAQNSPNEKPPYLTPGWWINSYQSGAPEYG